MHIKFQGESVLGPQCLLGAPQPGESGPGLELIPGAWAEGITAWGVGRMYTNVGLEEMPPGPGQLEGGPPLSQEGTSSWT